MKDENYIKTAEAYIKQKRLSIEHGNETIKYYEKCIELHHEVISANREQNKYDRLIMEKVQKDLTQYLLDNPE